MTKLFNTNIKSFAPDFTRTFPNGLVITLVFDGAFLFYIQ